MNKDYLAKNLADSYLNGILAVGRMENDLIDILGLNDDQEVTVGGDYYDWSLEIRLHGVDHALFKFSREQADKILDWGCNCFWINFHDSGPAYEYDQGKENFRCRAQISVGRHPDGAYRASSQIHANQAWLSTELFIWERK